jgi:hypothetical protein
MNFLYRFHSRESLPKFPDFAAFLGWLSVKHLIPLIAPQTAADHDRQAAGSRWHMDNKP